MRRVCLGRHSLDDNGHETVESAAQLGALPVKDTLPLDESVDPVDSARSGVCLDTQSGNRESVQDVLASDQETDVRSRGKRQALVDLQVADHARLQILISHQVALELVE